MIDNITNNEDWASIRSKLNDAIAIVNNIEANSIPVNFDSFETDSTGAKLTKGSLVFFKSSKDKNYYKIDAEKFIEIVSEIQ